MYRVIGGDEGILMSFDPVAHDAIGVQLAVDDLSAAGLSPEAAQTQTAYWLETGTEIGLGTNDLKNIDLMEVNLG